MAVHPGTPQQQRSKQALRQHHRHDRQQERTVRPAPACPNGQSGLSRRLV
jgi:hypothetical protein